ncbi:Transcriptional regulatory protein WalR [Paenibacillus sp. JJ-100]|uniref:response regulator transcription factor n=1 Tax=Paenibacillus sp. JJ-100 TaxID=2974896 RepID=UPI0022FF8805|nr:response regulator transcription factor [Paenibacillus sp. JJ-100]CAI6084359.1 Transcriptional regulatory protein WalR [Paenibacillus sp. JJ-100]
MSSHRLLLVEDDRSISEMVGPYLEKEGFDLTYAYDGLEAERLFIEAKPGFDLIILDLMLPQRSGMDVLQTIRASSLVPVLILSAKDGEVDKALGLGFGADDYLSKPFSLIELTARIKACIRRANYTVQTAEVATQDQRIMIGELVVNMETYEVERDGQPIKLTSKEFGILKLLVTHPGKVFTKAQIYASVWNDHYYGDENIINVHMRRLREKLEADPSAPRYIKTLWGIGYKLEAEPV